MEIRIMKSWIEFIPSIIYYLVVINIVLPRGKLANSTTNAFLQLSMPRYSKLPKVGKDL